MSNYGELDKGWEGGSRGGGVKARFSYYTLHVDDFATVYSCIGLLLYAAFTFSYSHQLQKHAPNEASVDISRFY